MKKKRILDYNKYIKENNYIEDPEHRIKKFFQELEKNIKFWFDEGSLSVNNAVLYDIKFDTSNNVEKYLIFDFQDDDFYYQVIVIVTLQEVEEETLDNCYVKVKKYDIDSSELLRQLSENVEISELNEDKILELFAKLDEQSDSILGEDEDDNTLSDEDSNLDDTEIV